MKNKTPALDQIVTFQEIENLKELIERQKASMRILLSAASSQDKMEKDDVVMTMRDSCGRIAQMEKCLGHLSEMISGMEI